MVIKIKLLILLLFISAFSFAQREKKTSYRKQCKIDSERQINELRNGVLLVRLKTKKKTISAMRKAKRYKLADKTEQELKKRNQFIITGFKSNFNFCPVYFFYSHDSKYVRNNNLDSISFLNDSLIIDNSITVNNSNIYVAEFGSVYPDTMVYSQSEYFEYGKKQTTNYGGSALTITALIIKSNQFTQLKDPFPYFVREFKGLLIQRSIKKAIYKMNAKLVKFVNE